MVFKGERELRNEAKVERSACCLFSGTGSMRMNEGVP